MRFAPHDVDPIDTVRGEPISLDRFPRIDAVLAADCVYFEPAYPLLIQTLCDLHALNPQAEFLFCYRQRRKVLISKPRAPQCLISLPSVGRQEVLSVIAEEALHLEPRAF